MNELWLVGSGIMALDYYEVLKELNVKFDVIGRGDVSANNFYKKTGKNVIKGFSKIINSETSPSIAIVAVNIENILEVTRQLLISGTKNILIEKPGSLNLSNLIELNDLANKKNSKIYIAYNRRFFSSVIELKKRLVFDEGLRGIFFDFTEWSHLIKNLDKSQEVLNRWLIANSTHVIDLAFHLAGLPKENEYKFFKSGKLDWHPSGSKFNGSGITQQEIPFSYFSDWDAPGRWSLELLTKKNRYILKPMEKLQKIEKGSIKVDEVNIDDSLDKKFKPGLYTQVKKFLFKETKDLCSLSEHIKAFPFYKLIAGY